VYGVWGGATEYDRHSVKDLSTDDAIEELERTLPQRITDRVDGWRRSVDARSPGRLGKPVLSKREKRIDVMLGAKSATACGDRTRTTGEPWDGA
jgi:hypothetical protein